MSDKGKNTLLFVAILVLLFPFGIFPLRDGGTVVYQGLIYRVESLRQSTVLVHEDGKVESGYIDGYIVEIFGVEVINTSHPVYTSVHYEDPERLRIRESAVNSVVEEINNGN